MPIYTRCPECDTPGAPKGQPCPTCGADVPDDGDMAYVLAKVMGASEEEARNAELPDDWDGF